MSQAGIVNTQSAPSPPTSLTTIVTDVGTVIVAANTVNMNGGQTTANTTAGIRTIANPTTSNNEVIQLTNRLQGQGSTVGAVTADIITFALGATPGTFKFHFEISGFNALTPAGLGYSIEASVRTTGVAATVVSIPDGDEDEEAALSLADWAVIASGNNAILRVTGVAGLTINWGSVGYYVFRG